MPNPVFYTPPLWRPEAGNPAPVRRRHVVYVPGYDYEAKTRSRSLFVRELVRYGRRFGFTERTVTPVQDMPDVPGLRWTVRTAKDDWAVDTVYDVMRWDDIVERDFQRPLLVRLFWLLVGQIDCLFTGLTYRLFKTNWLFACVGLYPFVMVVLLGLAAWGVGWGADRLLGLAGAPGWAALLGGLAIAGGMVALVYPYFDRWYVWHLLYDWLFNWQHGNGRRIDYLGRVDRFADHLRAVVSAGEADEVLVVGHSSGAGMALETVSRALEGDPGLGSRGPEVAVLTIGTSLPAAALNSRARAIHRSLERVMTERDIEWVEYQSPQDWLNAAGFNPLRMLPLTVPESACANPLVRTPRFREITTAATYRTILKSPFRLHFQFMMANDFPGEYDWVMMLLGPMRLSWRVRHPEEAKALSGAPLGKAEPVPA